MKKEAQRRLSSKEIRGKAPIVLKSPTSQSIDTETRRGRHPCSEKI